MINFSWDSNKYRHDQRLIFLTNRFLWFREIKDTNNSNDSVYFLIYFWHTPNYHPKNKYMLKDNKTNTTKICEIC